MNDTPNAVAAILLQMGKDIVTTRSKEHGDTERSFKAIAELWTTYLRASNEYRHCVTPIIVDHIDVAEMMSLLKKMRFIFGDHSNAENFVDDAAYSAIAGMFAGVPVQDFHNLRDTRIAGLKAVDEAIGGR